jgi:hypothetical protein
MSSRFKSGIFVLGVYSRGIRFPLAQVEVTDGMFTSSPLSKALVPFCPSPGFPKMAAGLPRLAKFQSRLTTNLPPEIRVIVLRRQCRDASPQSALTYIPGLRAKIAARTERHESVDRCTTLELGFNRERAVQDLQPLIHAD